MKHLQTDYPKILEPVAEVIGLQRIKANVELNKKVKRYQRGDKDPAIAKLGVLCELIFSYYLDENDIDHTLNKLLDDKPVVGFDIMINENAFDVKGIPTGKNRFLVNEEAHNKNKGIDYYAFVRPNANYTADIWVYSKNEISSWEVINAGFSNAYHKTIQ